MRSALAVAMGLLAAALACGAVATAFHLAASSADARCATDDGCYVSPGLGDSILAARFTVAAAVLALIGAGVLAWALAPTRHLAH